VTDRADQALGLEGVDQPARGGAVLGQRLLDHRVDAGLGQSQADLLVVDRRNRDHAVVDADREELLDAFQQRKTASDAVLVTAWVDDGDEVDTLEPAQDPTVVASHHAQPDQARAQVRHLRHLPWQER
jgi:PleD family two-component response regulator